MTQHLLHHHENTSLLLLLLLRKRPQGGELRMRPADLCPRLQLAQFHLCVTASGVGVWPVPPELPHPSTEARGHLSQLTGARVSVLPLHGARRHWTVGQEKERAMMRRNEAVQAHWAAHAVLAGEEGGGGARPRRDEAIVPAGRRPLVSERVARMHTLWPPQPMAPHSRPV